MVFFSWLYGILALLVRFFLGSPVLFAQERPGKIDPQTGKPKIFKLYKFRSMTNETDENGRLLPDSKRLSKFGKILRATSLDEIPEAWNILRGDMSVVGPRPLLVKYLDYYNDFEMKRQEVRPGLTGLAQVSGRNALSWENKFKKDAEYVENVSFKLDVTIVLKTIVRVFRREGIVFDEGHKSIMDYFSQRS